MYLQPGNNIGKTAVLWRCYFRFAYIKKVTANIKKDTIIICGIKLLIPSQTSKVQLLEFANG